MKVLYPKKTRMMQIPVRKQKEARRLRKDGFSHRQIAKKLNIGQGTAVKYSLGVQLSEEQSSKLKWRSNQYLVAYRENNYSQWLKGCRRGGIISSSKIKYSKEELIDSINDFVAKEGRIPLKREFPHYRAVRRVFGTWNKAIKAAGLIPNPVLFAKKFIANDGHKCDSLSEKIVDDWLSYRGVEHQINVPYPGKGRFTSDFMVGDYWIEFFGLSGELRRYDELKKKKLKIAKAYCLKIIALYPKDLFPVNKLEDELAVLF